MEATQGSRKECAGVWRALWVALVLVTLGASPAGAITYIHHYPFTLDRPGETYVLVRDLFCADDGLLTVDESFYGATFTVRPALHITANDVTLLLNGHTIGGPFSTVRVGILVKRDAWGVRILGAGRVADGYTGIMFADGGRWNAVRGVHVDRNYVGIYLAHDHRDSSLVGNQVTVNGYGIALDEHNAGNLIADNQASGNAYGIYLGGHNADNEITGNDASGNGNAGIELGFDNTNNRLIGNHADRNYQFGIVLFLAGNNGNRIEFNTAHENGGQPGYGIFVAEGSVDNRLRFNRALGNHEADLFDGNPDCDADVWQYNGFDTAFPDCIR